MCFAGAVRIGLRRNASIRKPEERLVLLFNLSVQGRSGGGARDGLGGGGGGWGGGGQSTTSQRQFSQRLGLG